MPDRPTATTKATVAVRGEPLDWIALSLLPGLGSVLLNRALERFGDPATIAYRLPPEVFLSLGRIRREHLNRLVEARRTLARKAEKIMRLCERSQIRIVTCSDAGFPAALRELADPPPLLYQRGELREGVLRVAVVGSRTPTTYGRRVAVGLAGGLALREIEVVSGAARGIDRCAHEGALEEQGRTVAVLGTGLLRPYPPENEELIERIAGQGAVLSEFPPDEPPRAENFPRRDQGREVLAVPGPVSSDRSAGTNRLIQDGAKLVQNIDDILVELPPLYRSAAVRPQTSQPAPRLGGLSPDERSVLGILDDIEPTQLDELADRAPFGVARLQAALLGLQLRAAVEQLPGRYYVSRPLGEG